MSKADLAPFSHIAIIGLGLIGSSVARAVRRAMPAMVISGYDADADIIERAKAVNICDHYHAGFDEHLRHADLVMLCVPVGAMESVAQQMAGFLAPDVVISDVGSCKQSVAEALRRALPDAHIIPAHPVAGTEKSGPEAGFATLFSGRWCIITPETGGDSEKCRLLQQFWQNMGANVEFMDAAHHDRVLAITSHLPHLIAFCIVGTARNLEIEDVDQSEVIKYSAGGFRDFTRIAASDPVMWRDVFLSNKVAVLEMLQRFSEDLTSLQRAIRRDEGDALEDWFAETRTIRRSIIEQGQDDPGDDFGRNH